MQQDVNICKWPQTHAIKLETVRPGNAQFSIVHDYVDKPVYPQGKGNFSPRVILNTVYIINILFYVGEKFTADNAWMVSGVN